MKTMNPDVLQTAYGLLVVDLIKTAISAEGDAVLSKPTNELASYGIRLADNIVAHLVEREQQAKDLAESTRVLIAFDWAPGPEDAQSRSGEHWSQPEIDALVAQFKNGLIGSQIALFHRRSWTAISAQLAKYGLLVSTGRSGYEYQNGDVWEL